VPAEVVFGGDGGSLRMTWRPEWEEQPRRGFGFGGGGGGWGATKTLVALCVGVTFVSMVIAAAGGGQPLNQWFGLSLRNAAWIYPWFTYVFPHDATDVTHILFNGILLWFLGVDLEARLGRRRFLTLFFGSALVGAIAHVVIQAVASDNPAQLSFRLIGASGGIFGLIFYIARETPNRPFFFFIIAVPARVLAGILLIKETFPLLSNGFNSDGIAHLCHLGGAAFGLLWYSRPFDAFEGLASLRDRWRAHAAARARERVASDDAEMDRLLKKIHDTGMESLTGAERSFLDERSRNLRGGRR
jgi:membrane associated rhomboid family serine protease